MLTCSTYHAVILWDFKASFVLFCPHCAMGLSLEIMQGRGAGVGGTGGWAGGGEGGGPQPFTEPQHKHQSLRAKIGLPMASSQTDLELGFH